MSLVERAANPVAALSPSKGESGVPSGLRSRRVMPAKAGTHATIRLRVLSAASERAISSRCFRTADGGGIAWCRDSRPRE